jgi:hypothetical protein
MLLNPITYAHLANAAYSTTPDWGDEDGACRVIWENTEDGDAFGFPGTNNIATVEADLEIETHSCELGRVHKGFWDAVATVFDEFAPHAPRVLYGHSEGAALALITAARLCLRGTPPKAVFAFEPPRISCDKRISQILHQYGVIMFGYRNGNDIVPTVPRAIPFFEWQHPCDLLQIGTPALPIDNVEDHAMDKVIAAVEEHYTKVLQLRKA